MIAETSACVANPFPGLRPFEPDDAKLFFGRDREIEEISERLRTTRFLAVTGVSGCGKSSLVKAGLLARLQRGLLVSQDARWHIASFRPGHDPVGNLATALGALPLPPGLNVRHTLEDGPFGIIETVAAAALGEGDKVLILADQFEELFSASDYREVNRPTERAKELVSLLLSAAEQRDYPIYIVLTMRSEFVGHCSAFPRLSECLNAGVYLVPQMTRRQFREAIEKPVQLCGGTISGRLVDSLLNDASFLDDQLPLLQHALSRMWARAPVVEGVRRLDLPEYKAVGPDLASCLDKHGSEILSRLSPEQVQMAERLFRHITDVDAGGRKIRHPDLFKNIDAAVGDTRRLKEVLDVFRAPDCSFVVPLLPEPLRPESRIDLTHESLMRQWSALRAWVEDEGRISAAHRRLAERARLWHERQRDDSFLFRGAELAEAEALAECRPALQPLEREFLSTSQARRDREARVKALQARVVEWSVNDRSRKHLLSGRDLEQAQELVRDARGDIDELDRQFVARSSKAIVQERRRRLLRRAAVFVGVIALSAASFLIVSETKEETQEAQQKIEQLSRLRKLDTQWDDPDLAPPTGGAAPASQARLASAWLADVGPDEARRLITVRFYQPGSSAVNNLLLQTWEQYGFTVPRVQSRYRWPVTSIWAGSQVPLSDIKIVACTLIRAGMPIRWIGPVENSSRKPRDIEIGGSNPSPSQPLWTVQEVLAAKQFAQTEDEPMKGRGGSAGRYERPVR